MKKRGTAEKNRESSLLVPLVWAVVVVALSCLPYIAGIAAEPPGGTFTGFTYNIDDACVYSSWVRQIADGSLLIRNQFTSEPQNAFQFNIFFVLLGIITKITHLSAASVLHLARIILGIAFLVFVWKFSHHFLKEPAERLLIVPVIGLSAGLGWILPGYFEGHSGPVDMWQPEALTFLSIYLNPLFLAGLILMVASFHYLHRMSETGAWRDAMLAGIMLLLLANVHTYDILTVGAVWTAYLVVKFIQARKIAWKTVLQSTVAALMTLPAITYSIYLYHSEEVFRQRVESAAPSPELWAYLMGFGLVLLLAVAGVWIALKEHRSVILLVVWSIVGFALPYIPVDQQRKLVMGLHIPLAILAVIAIVAISRKVGPKLAGVTSMLIVLVLVPSNLLFIARDIAMLGENRTAPHYRPYLAHDEMDALNWLRENTKPEDVVLAFPDIALFAPAVSGNRVYYGHWSETPNYGDKLQEWMLFINAAIPDEWRREFLEESQARYIVYFSHPEGLELPFGEAGKLPVADLRNADYVEVAYESGDTAVYAVKLLGD